MFIAAEIVSIQTLTHTHTKVRALEVKFISVLFEFVVCRIHMAHSFHSHSRPALNFHSEMLLFHMRARVPAESRRWWRWCMGAWSWTYIALFPANTMHWKVLVFSGRKQYVSLTVHLRSLSCIPSWDPGRCEHMAKDRIKCIKWICSIASASLSSVRHKQTHTSHRNRGDATYSSMASCNFRFSKFQTASHLAFVARNVVRCIHLVNPRQPSSDCPANRRSHKRPPTECRKGFDHFSCICATDFPRRNGAERSKDSKFNCNNICNDTI